MKMARPSMRLKGAIQAWPQGNCSRRTAGSHRHRHTPLHCRWSLPQLGIQVADEPCWPAAAGAHATTAVSQWAPCVHGALAATGGSACVQQQAVSTSCRPRACQRWMEYTGVWSEQRVPAHTCAGVCRPCQIHRSPITTGCCLEVIGWLDWLTGDSHRATGCGGGRRGDRSSMEAPSSWLKGAGSSSCRGSRFSMPCASMPHQQVTAMLAHASMPDKMHSMAGGDSLLHCH